MWYSEATPLGETHVLTVLTHLWFAAEIAPVEEQKFLRRICYEEIDHAHVREGANEDMKFLFFRLLEKWTTTRGRKFAVRDLCLLLD
jgi:hypothetical protein